MLTLTRPCAQSPFLTAADKRRLNGQILGVISKGDGAAAGLRDWLGHALGSPTGTDTLPRSA